MPSEPRVAELRSTAPQQGKLQGSAEEKQREVQVQTAWLSWLASLAQHALDGQGFFAYVVSSPECSSLLIMCVTVAHGGPSYEYGLCYARPGNEETHNKSYPEALIRPEDRHLSSLYIKETWARRDQGSDFHTRC